MINVLYEDDSVAFKIIDNTCYFIKNNTQYLISGQPYEPCIYIDNLDKTHIATIHDKLWFPDMEASGDEWKAFCYELSKYVS